MSRLLADLRRRIQLTAARCILRQVHDDRGVQGTQVTLLKGETRELQRMQQYGFTSHPRPNTTEGVALFLNGNRDHGVVVATEDRSARHYPLEAGEVALYTDEGDLVALEREHQVRVQALGGRIRLQAPETAVEGDLTVTADVTAQGDVQDGVMTMAQMRAIFDAHTHAETGSVTGPPNILMGGGGQLPGGGDGGGGDQGPGELVTIDAGQVVSGTFDDARVAESNVTQHQAAIDHDQLANFDEAEHRRINDAGTGATDLWSAQKIAAEIASASGGGGGAVDSVFGRTGTVAAASGDYDASQVDVTPAGGLAATDVQAALEELDTEKAPVSHAHAASDVTSGTFADARISESSVTQHEAAIDHNALANYDPAEHRTINDLGLGASDLWSAAKITTAIAAGVATVNVPVDSVHGRTGDVTAAAGDYDAAQVDFTPAGNLAATDVQAALEELDAEKAAAAHTHAQYLAPAYWSGGSTSMVTLSGLTVLPLEAEDISSGAGQFTMSAANDDLEVLEAGVYDVRVEFTATKTVGTAVSVCRAILFLDTGGGFGAVSRAAGYVKLRVAGELGTTSFGAILNLSAGDKLKVQAQITTGSNIDVPGQGYVLSVRRVG